MKITGLEPDDGLLQSRQKQVALWLSITCILGVAAHLVLRMASDLSYVHLEIILHITLMLLFMASIVWYFVMKSQSGIKYLLMLSGPGVVVSEWLRMECDLSNAGTDAFCASFIIISLLPCIGATRREILAYVTISLALVTTLYTLHFTSMANGREPWCPLPMPRSALPRTMVSVIAVIGTHLALYIAIAINGHFIDENAQLLCEDFEASQAMLEAIHEWDTAAIRDLASDVTICSPYSRDLMVRVQERIVGILPYLPDTVFQQEDAPESSPKPEALAPVFNDGDRGGGDGGDNSSFSLPSMATGYFEDVTPPDSDGELGTSHSQLKPGHPQPRLSGQRIPRLRHVAEIFREISRPESSAQESPTSKPTKSLQFQPITAEPWEDIQPPPPLPGKKPLCKFSPTKARTNNPLAHRQDSKNGLKLVQEGLRNRRVTVLVVNLVGVNEASEALGPDLEESLGTATGAIIDIVKQKRGAVVWFSGGIVFAAFNALLSNSSHATYACHAALAVRARLARATPPWRVRIAMHTCAVLAGNISGNHRGAAGFNCIGFGVRACFMLAQLNQALGTEILMSAQTHSQSKDHFVTRGVDVVRFTEPCGRSMVDAGHSSSVMAVYELVEESQDNDEWMYTLESRDQNVSLYDKGFKHLLKADYASASLCFLPHVEQSQDDKSACRLLAIATHWNSDLCQGPYHRQMGVPWNCPEEGFSNTESEDGLQKTEPASAGAPQS